MGCRAANIDLSEEERAGLGRLVRALSTPQQLALRARIILLASDGVGIEETAERLGVWRKTVSCWRKRWHSSAGAPGPAADRLRAALRGTGADHSRAGLCGHRPGLRAAGNP